MPKYGTPRYKTPRGPTVIPRRTHSDLTDEGWSVVDQLVAARFAAGLTQQQLADRMGVSPGKISGIERGAGMYGPSATIMVRYARAVGLTSITIPSKGSCSCSVCSTKK